MMYKVKEIFKSIQGEGFFSGKEAVFLRFTGCNLWNGRKKDKSKSICNFCDTDFLGTNGKNGGKYNLEELISVANNVWNCTYTSQKKFIVLTGGEPLLQVDDLLIKKLKRENFFVAVETNGTIKTNLEFHRTLYLRAQAPAMLATAETVWLQLGPTMRALYGKLQRKEPPHFHRIILSALSAGDEPGLRVAVRSDVIQGLRMLTS